METNDKSLFFLTLSLTCIWVVLDNIFGKKHLSNLLDSMFGLSDDVAGSETTTQSIVKDVVTGIAGTDYIVETETGNNSEDGTDAPEYEDTTAVSYTCKRCNKSFTTKKQYATHKCNVKLFPDTLTIFGTPIKIGKPIKIEKPIKIGGFTIYE